MYVTQTYSQPHESLVTWSIYMWRGIKINTLISSELILVFTQCLVYRWWYINFFTVADDVNSEDAFLYELKSAYRSCTKEGNAPIPISVLADKYVEMHSKEEYKKNLKGTRLKTFLSKSGHFNCTGDKVTMIIGNVFNHNLKQLHCYF